MMYLSTNTKRQIIAVILCGVVALLVCVPGLFFLIEQDSNSRISATTTAVVVDSLTEQHGEEVEAVIEDFEIKWHSLERHHNPYSQYEIATARYVEYLQNEGNVEPSDGDTYILMSADVVGIEVWHYTPDQFKTYVCIQKSYNLVNFEGVLQESLSPEQVCGIYVFVNEEEVWKVAVYFDTTYPGTLRDWSYVPEWVRELIGELPDSALMPITK